jgi:hypothetical protein
LKRSVKKIRRRKSKRFKQGIHHSIKCATLIKYRSGWELAYAKYLDCNDDVVSYLYEPYYIHYLSNLKTGKLRKYWPDFEVTWLSGNKTLVEIKPRKKLVQIRNIKKMNAARIFASKNNLEYVIITEVELKSLALIK